MWWCVVYLVCDGCGVPGTVGGKESFWPFESEQQLIGRPAGALLCVSSLVDF